MVSSDRTNRKPCVLITGFGRFPGAAFNPSAPLARALSHLHRPALSGVRLIGHVFPTSYDAVDRELPMLLEKYRPDIVLMFGVAPRSKAVRIETRAHNVFSHFPDAKRLSPGRRKIIAGAKASLPGRAPFQRMLHATRAAQHGSVLSRNAGGYLCNYVYWRALEAARRPDGPTTVAFVHVPPCRSGAARLRPTAKGISAAGLRRISEAILAAMIADLSKARAD